MPIKIPALSNPTNLGLHLAPGLDDEFISEAQFILDNTASKGGNKQSIQETIDALSTQSQNWMEDKDVDDMFAECHGATTEEPENNE